MSLFAKKLIGVSAALALLVVMIVLYIANWATDVPRSIAAVGIPVDSTGASTQLTMQTVASVGASYSPQHPTWVSYLIQDKGKWVRSTIYKVPANSIVHVTIYQYDSPTGLRNPFLSQVQGTVGGVATIDGKQVNAIEPEEASHTFAVPELGVFVPLPGVPTEAKHACEEAPCTSSNDHRTISFSFRTGKKGRYRWQCFVPCGAGFIAGNGGPMQTLGYMDGFIDVV